MLQTMVANLIVEYLVLTQENLPLTIVRPFLSYFYLTARTFVLHIYRRTRKSEMKPAMLYLVLGTVLVVDGRIIRYSDCRSSGRPCESTGTRNMRKYWSTSYQPERHTIRLYTIQTSAIKASHQPSRVALARRF